MDLIDKLSKKIIKKYKPTIIGIAGDYDRGPIRDAIYWLLKENNNGLVRKSEENIEDFSGIVQSTIIGCKRKDKRLKKILKAFSLLLFKKSYPKYLVIVYPANVKGKLKQLLEIAQPKIGIFTSVTDRNKEFFKSLKQETKEKSQIVTSLGADDLAIINSDDEYIVEIKDKIKAKALSYGFNEDADIKGDAAGIVAQVNENVEDCIKGIQFKLNYNGNNVPFFMPNVLGVDHIKSMMVVVAIAEYLGINMVKVNEFFANYESSLGRLRLIKGIKHTLIIDDTFDSDFEARLVAIQTLGLIKKNENATKYAVVGAVMQDKDVSVDILSKLGKTVYKNNVDCLIAVGDKGKYILQGAVEAGLDKEKCFIFANYDEGGRFLQQKMQKGDIVLITGPKELKLEKIVKEVMAQPNKAEEIILNR